MGGSRVTAGMSAAASLAAERLLAQGGTGRVTVTVEPGDAHPVTSCCVQVAQVEVDVETGRVAVDEIITAVDVAAILHPASHLTQIEGGVAMGLGFACLEDLGIEEGQVTAGHMGVYTLPSFRDIPRLPVVLVEGGIGIGPDNVKAIGELSNVPVAAAIANAVADAVGVRITRLPITAEAVHAALRARERS